MNAVSPATSTRSQSVFLTVPVTWTAVSASSVSRTLWSVPGPDRMFVRVVNSLGQSAGPTR